MESSAPGGRDTMARCGQPYVFKCLRHAKDEVQELHAVAHLSQVGKGGMFKGAKKGFIEPLFFPLCVHCPSRGLLARARRTLRRASLSARAAAMCVCSPLQESDSRDASVMLRGGAGARRGEARWALSPGALAPDAAGEAGAISLFLDAVNVVERAVERGNVGRA